MVQKHHIASVDRTHPVPLCPRWALPQTQAILQRRLIQPRVMNGVLDLGLRDTDRIGVTPPNHARSVPPRLIAVISTPFAASGRVPQRAARPQGR
jgi:hypothetical protein